MFNVGYTTEAAVTDLIYSYHTSPNRGKSESSAAFFTARSGDSQSLSDLAFEVFVMAGSLHSQGGQYFRNAIIWQSAEFMRGRQQNQHDHIWHLCSVQRKGTQKSSSFPSQGLCLKRRTGLGLKLMNKKRIYYTLSHRAAEHSPSTRSERLLLVFLFFLSLFHAVWVFVYFFLSFILSFCLWHYFCVSFFLLSFLIFVILLFYLTFFLFSPSVCLSLYIFHFCM